VDLKYPPDAEAFRQEIRDWLEVNAPKGEHRPFDTITVANDAEWQARKDWYRKLHSGGWVGISWPKAYGGRLSETRSRGAAELQTPPAGHASRRW